MIRKNLTGYQNLFINTCKSNNWKPIIETTEDKKLVDILFEGQLPNIAARKKMSMKSLIFIIFGRDAIEQLLDKGLID